MDQNQQTVLASIAKSLQIPLENIQTAVELLDEGNTIPFIARFRKDRTGNLDGRQLREIRHLLNQKRGLVERKNYIIKSIESQGRFNDELKQKIESATTSKELEDLFLPFKPKKQSMATVAKQKGLEPLARDILEGVSPEIDLATRSTEFVRVDKDLNTIDEVIEGVSHIIAERFSENVELRSRLRKVLWESGKLVTTRVETEEANAGKADKKDSENEPAAEKKSKPNSDLQNSDQPKTESEKQDAALVDAVNKESGSSETGESGNAAEPVDATEPSTEIASDTHSVETGVDQSAETSHSESQSEAAAAESPAVESSTTSPATSETAESPSETPQAAATPDNAEKSEAKLEPAKDAAKPKPKKKKKKKKKSKEDTQFQDYFNFSEALKKLPPHRVLAINRGERAKKIRVRIDRDADQFKKIVSEILVPEGHPFSQFLEKCALDSLNRMIVPALEREIRRELTETAEQHALQVFERNLRMLLLQPPVEANSLMAIDPGFRSGCHIAILDKHGQLVANHRFHIVGNQQKLAEGREALVKWIKEYHVDLIAIGNGTGCRATEQIISDLIKEHFADSKLRFVIVNEAGTSVYSTSEIGREELPNADPVVRSAVSIGRRLLDPLSELVKVNPANLGVGLYQHDVKAKHLGQALDEAVESCVNFVGVDVNTASPSLLRYISGLGQLTARRVVEYRQENGAFKNRLDLKNISGFGDATFVQSAGFLRVYAGDQLLDGSSIHPESYELAGKILDKIGFSIEDLPIRRTATAIPPAPKASDEKSENRQEPAAQTESKADDNPTEANPAASPAKDIDASAASTTEANLAESDLQTATDSTTAEVATPESTKNEETPAAAIPTDTPAETSTDAPVTDSSRSQPASETAAAEQQEANAESSGPPAADAAPVESTPTENTPEPTVDPAAQARQREMRDKLKGLNTAELSQEFNVGELLIKDVILSLMRPGRDPRSDLPKPIFRRGIIKLEDLKPGMQLKAQVLNVVDFGVFVDIGLGESSLIHISQLSRKFVRDPYRFFSIGDILNVWVNEVDTERRRVSLTAIRPESARTSRKKPRVAQKDRGAPRGRRNDKPQSRRRDQAARRDRPKRKSAPPKPITKGMVEGEEPMRSFSDLAQFYELRDDDPSKKKK